MANTLDRFEAGSLAKSLDVHRPDFQQDIQLTPATVNMTSGLQEGIGPRYGMAPLPGHADTEAVAAGKAPGMMAAEATGITYRPGVGYTFQRSKIFAVYPVKMRGDGTVLDVTKTYTFYVAVVGVLDTNNPVDYMVDALLLSTYTGPQNSLAVVSSVPSSDFRDGLPYAGASLLNDGVSDLTTAMIPGSSFPGLASLLAIDQASAYVSATPFSVSGIEIAMPWLAGVATSTGDASHVPKIATMNVQFSGASIAYTAGGGIPPSFNYGNFPTTLRGINVFCLDSYGDQSADFSGTITPTATNYLPLRIDDPETQKTTIDISGVALTKLSGLAGNNPGQPDLYNDASLTCNSSHQGIMVATGKSAVMFLLQDWYKGQAGNQTQYVDLCNIPLAPPTFNYSQDGANTPCCFAEWPNYVTGTAMTALTGVQLGAVNTGLLRANTVYEFAYSVYDKRLNYETNVGQPVRIQTGATDFIALQLWSSTFTANAKTMAANLAHNGSTVLPWPGTTSTFVGSSGQSHVYLNYIEYRFYYRQLGMQEWLPALFIDAAKWWFYPHHTPLLACTGGIGGLVGGRPGGFADYSPLPKDTWNCVVVFKNRAFWFSERACSFSLLNNMLAYAGRNSAACPIGVFRGAVVAAYYGQASQDARLVVFGSRGTYVGKFTGNLQQVPVQVSPTTVAQFGLDGSDFVLNAWTSITAFSHRAAVVAEGILYFWGPHGFFRDAGAAEPQRISIPLEPDCAQWYDPSKTDQIHAVYNDVTKEIVWFYPPKGGDVAYPTHAVVYNTAKGTWLPQKYAGQVDAAQQIHVDSPTGIGGTRLLAFARQSPSSSVQRAYFYDQRNLSGDVYPGGELMVKQVATPSAGLRRLTLAAGHSTGTIAAGDLVLFQQTNAYQVGMALVPTDMLAVVSAVGAGTVDVTLPPGATMDAAWTAASNAGYFPVWHAAAAGLGINGFPFELDTKYWIPGGMGYWAYWLYLHLVFKLTANLPAAAAPTVSLGYRTPISGETQTDVLTLTDNSDGNFQVLHPLTNVDQNLEGQGISLTVSGIQVGGAWVLQYLQAFAKALDGFQLKTFEG